MVVDHAPAIGEALSGLIRSAGWAMMSGAMEFLTKPFGDEGLLVAIRLARSRSAENRNRRAESLVSLVHMAEKLGVDR